MPRNVLVHLQLWMSTALLTATGRVSSRRDPEQDNDRGDVPGWVMITVMTAIVVIALLTVFRDQVTTAVTNAFQSVSGSGKK